MYVWNLSAMRDQLRAGPLPPSEQFTYLLAATLFSWACAQPPFYGPFGWNVLIGAANIFIVGFAIYYAYRCNGGPDGERFLERYICLGWILMIRFFVLLILPLFALRDAFTSTGAPSGTVDMLFHLSAVTASQLLFYWLLGNQMRAVSRPAI